MPQPQDIRRTFDCQKGSGAGILGGASGDEPGRPGPHHGPGLPATERGRPPRGAGDARAGLPAARSLRRRALDPRRQPSPHHGILAHRVPCRPGRPRARARGRGARATLSRRRGRSAHRPGGRRRAEARVVEARGSAYRPSDVRGDRGTVRAGPRGRARGEPVVPRDGSARLERPDGDRPDARRRGGGVIARGRHRRDWGNPC
jgi:hypothetical protein